MEFSYDSKLLNNILDIVSMKGKWLGSTGLTNDLLGEYVKVIKTNEGFRTGLYFLNANASTYVSYYIPEVVEKEEEYVIEIAKFQKYLKSMDSDVTVTIAEGGCEITNENKAASFPSAIVHPNESAINMFFKSKDTAFFGGEAEPLTWGKTVLESSVVLLAEEFIEAMKALENVGHGIYSMSIRENSLNFTTNKDNREGFSTSYVAQTIGDAVVDFTGPLYKSLPKTESLSINFNDDSVIVICTPNVTIGRAPYVVV